MRKIVVIGLDVVIMALIISSLFTVTPLWSKSQTAAAPAPMTLGLAGSAR